MLKWSRYNIVKIVKHSVWILFVIIFIGCAAIEKKYKTLAKEHAALSKKGYFDEGTYINDFYEFRITGPKGWKTYLSPAFRDEIWAKFVSKDELSDFSVEIVDDDRPSNDVVATIKNVAKNFGKRPGMQLISTGEVTEKDGKILLEQAYRQLDFQRGQLILKTRFIKGPNFVLILIGRSLETAFARTELVFEKAFRAVSIKQPKQFIENTFKQRKSGTDLVTSRQLSKTEPIEKTVPIEDKDYIHTILWKGETISLISLWYTGHIKNWEKIASYNNIQQMEMLQLQQQIRIPRSLIVNERPLSKQWLESKIRNINQKKAEKKEKDSDTPIHPTHPSSPPPRIPDSELIEKLEPVGPKL